MSIFYKKSDPSKNVEIIDEQESFYQLSDGQMIKKDVFFKYYSEKFDKKNILNENNNFKSQESSKPQTPNSDIINPDNFFKNSSLLDEKSIEMIKNADPSKGVLEGEDRTIIKPYNNLNENNAPNAPNENIVKKVDPRNQEIPNNTNTDVSKYKVYEDDEEAYNDFIKRQNAKPEEKPIQQKPDKSELDKKIDDINLLYEDEKVAFGVEEAEQRKQKRLKKLNLNNIPQENNIEQQNNPNTNISNNVNEFDPSEMMFKSFKRNHDITINIKINDKIANPDFIKLMMENMEGDIVGFYKKIIMNKIFNDKSIIEDEVEKSIKKEIYGDDYNDNTNDKNNENDEYKDLIPGKKTKSGKQKYKYINNSNQIVDMLPSTAEKKGYKPHKN